MERYRDVVARLRAEQNLSLEDVAYRARRYAEEHFEEEARHGVSLSLIQKRLAPGNRRRPSETLLEALAAALEVEPQVFIEYRLAAARRIFDEEVVGLDQAVVNLRELERLLEEGALRPLDLAVEQALTTESRTSSEDELEHRRRGPQQPPA
jgi:transcriptional regulator with XRE-family HTH domain